MQAGTTPSFVTGADGAYEIESPRGQLWPEASFQQALVGCQGALEGFFAACRADHQGNASADGHAGEQIPAQRIGAEIMAV